MLLYRNLIFTLLVILSTKLKAQHNAYFFGGNWEKIKLNKNYLPAADDTCVIFASVRGYEENEKMFLGNDCDKNNKLHYFRLYFKGNNWVCVPYENLSLSLAGFQHKNAVVFVEGFGKTFLTALDRATLLARQYGLDVIMFDWPTYRPELKGGENFKIAVKESETVAMLFAQFTDSINAFKKTNDSAFTTISLILHSMGNLLLMHASQNNYLNVKDTLFNSIIINSPCVPEANHKLWVEKLSMQRNIYITGNNHDKTLRGAKVISGFRHQLGLKPQKPFADNALYIDFSRVLEKEHNYFLYPSVLNEHPYIKNIYYHLLLGKQLDFNNTDRFIRNPKKHSIEIFDLKEAQKGGIGIGIGL